MEVATDNNMFNKGFEDIEMLEIGETSSDVESISKSSIPSMDSVESEPIVLKEWLNSDKKLDFHFNLKEYKVSLDDNDEFSKVYTNYANKIYKITEDISQLDNFIPMDTEDEPMGLITSDKYRTRERRTAARDQQINDAFFKIVEEFNQFVTRLEEIDYQDIDKYETVLCILDCLQANIFYGDINTRPLYLVKWINRFDPQPEKELLEDVMLHTTKPYRHPLFWNKFISKLITRGLVDQAIVSIKKSGYEELQDEEVQLYQVIEDFVNLLETYNSMALRDQFAHWKLSCCEFRDVFYKFKDNIKSSDNSVMLSQLHDLVSILTGLPKTISYYCDSWYEIITSLSLYQIRDDKSIYSEYFNISLKEKPPLFIESGDIIKQTEKAFLNIFEGNLLHVLTRIAEVDSCCASLISMLLELKGLLTDYYSFDQQKSLEDLMKGKTISEYLLTTYAFQCLNNHHLVPVGIGILLNEKIASSSQSIENNKKIVEGFLPKYSCLTNDDLEWCLTICAKLGLVSTASELYRLYGTRSLKEGYLFEALNMLIHCYNGEEHPKETNEKGMKEVHHIIWDLIFQDSLVNNRPIDDELINNIVAHKIDASLEIHPLIKQCLSPYAVLYEFYNSIPKKGSLVNCKPAKQYLSRLIHLLEFMHLPKRFYPLLLAQLIPFFLESQYKFYIPDLIVIIELLDNYESYTVTEEIIKADELYKYTINNLESELKHYDWRKVLTEANIEVPKTTADLIKLIRNQIIMKTGEAYLENA